jgi:hypothetical protein
MKSFVELREDINEFETWEFTEEEWNKLTEEEQAEMEEASNGGAVWSIGDAESDDEVDGIYEDEDDLEEIRKYKARNTMQRRKTQLTKDRGKFKNRQKKLKAKIERKKGGNKVRRIKLRKKWIRRNKAKIKNAQRVYGGKVKSKYTKK